MPQTIKKHYVQICEQLAELKYLLNAATPMTATVATIPDKKPAEQTVHGTITPVHSTGTQAVANTCERYLDLHVKEGLCSKTARRTVGALLYCPSHNPLANQIPTCVDAINTAKENLKQYLILNFQERYQRFDALREQCPGVMSLHLYRQIRCMHNPPVEKLSFTWQRKNALARPKSKAELIKMFEDEIACASTERSGQLTELLQAVTATPFHQLRLRRLVQPQPSANVWSNGIISTINAPMPILVIQDSPLTIKPLRDFEPAVPPTNRTADKLATHVLGTIRGITVEQVLE